MTAGDGDCSMCGGERAQRVGAPEHGQATFRGRASVTPRLAVEPNISLNWIDLPQKSFTNTVIGERTLYSMTPRMFLPASISA